MKPHRACLESTTIPTAAWHRSIVLRPDRPACLRHLNAKVQFHALHLQNLC